MDKQSIEAMATEFCENTPLNYVGEDWGLPEKMLGMRLFDKPLMKVGRADDPWFEMLTRPEVIGAHFKVPTFWMSDAKSVISFFFPLTETIRASNRGDYPVPSFEWAVGRKEGQRLIDEMSVYIRDSIMGEGYDAVYVAKDKRYIATHPEPIEDVPIYNSNWSERHIAFVCGLGTFGLNSTIITEKGCAGRLTSLVTNMELEPDERDYSDRLEYCVKCGLCIKKCPYDAIHPDGSKNKIDCTLLQKFYSKVFLNQRYGCGRCMVGLPCEAKNPSRRRK